MESNQIMAVEMDYQVHDQWVAMGLTFTILKSIEVNGLWLLMVMQNGTHVHSTYFRRSTPLEREKALRIIVNLLQQ